MSVARVFEADHFSPDEIALLNTAFEQDLAELGLSKRTCTLALLVAENVLDAARQGERDVDQLRTIGIGAIAALT